jgi:iron(III) transport system ATP-binding protein
MNRLVVTDLHKSFATQRVLTGVELEVPAGSFTAILGPSGSGKTTLLRLLAGLDRADRGTVVIGDVVVDDEHTHVPAERRQLGYVSQEGSLFPHLTVEANVGFGLARHDRRGSRVAALLDTVGLTGLGRRYPHELSGGQQQRVAVARALAVRPQAVLLDEPFASLDAQLRATVRADVKEILKSAGTTAVLVTHDQDEALSVADFVAVIRDGKIAQVATPEELYARPVDAELARFVGAANLVEGSQDGTVVRCGLGEAVATSASGTAGWHEVTVLVRPEQIEIVPVEGGAAGADPARASGGETIGGVSARVLATSYHGHDCLVHVLPDLSAGAGAEAEVGGDAGGRGLGTILVRTLGDPQLAAGSAVTIRVRGAVLTWPANRSAGAPA